MEPVCGRGIEETSGTNGNGVHHYLRGPHDVVTLGHKYPVWTSSNHTRDIRILKQGVKPKVAYGSMLNLDRS